MHQHPNRVTYNNNNNNSKLVCFSNSSLHLLNNSLHLHNNNSPHTHNNSTGNTHTNSNGNSNGAGSDEGDSPGGAGGGPGAAATVLVQLAEKHYSFGVSTAGEVYAVPRTGPQVVQLLRGGKTSLRAELARRYWRTTHRAASSSALADALAVIEGIAQDTGETELYLRVAPGTDGSCWVDLGDPTGRAIRITGDGWTVEPAAPMLFRRSVLTAPLPVPVGGHGLDGLWQLLNVEATDRPLVAGWLIAALITDIPHCVLGVFGEQGTGKSTATKLLVSIIDPSPVPARTPPDDKASWVTAATGSWIVGLDNLSGIPAWLSDSLCRAVTGDGDIRRRLYSDGDLAVFAFRRCVALNGIDLGSIRGDLTDRLLPINLHPIADTERLDEAQLWNTWTTIHPNIVGGLCDLAVETLKRLPDIHLEHRPRMADYARIQAAVDKALGTTGLDTWLTKRGALATDAVEADAFLQTLLHTITQPWEGTSADLLAALPTPDTPPPGWPANARTVTTRLRRWAPTLRQLGWAITDTTTRTKTLTWILTPPQKTTQRDQPAEADPRPEMTPNQHPRHPRHPQPQATDPPNRGRTAGVAGVRPDQHPRHQRDTRAPEPPPTSPRGRRGRRGRPIQTISAPPPTQPTTHPCKHCGQPATDISQNCPTCLAVAGREADPSSPFRHQP
jgi:hypothetical protein